MAAAIDLPLRRHGTDHVYNSDDGFYFIGRAIVGPHKLDPQAQGFKLIQSAGVTDLFIVEDAEAVALFNAKRDEAQAAERAAEEARKRREDEARGQGRLDGDPEHPEPLPVGDTSDHGPGDGDDASS